MNINIPEQDADNYTASQVSLFYKYDPDPRAHWLFIHTYPSMLAAETGMRRHKNRLGCKGQSKMPIYRFMCIRVAVEFSTYKESIS